MMAKSLHDTTVENLFFDSCDEEDFPGFDEEDVRQASDRLMEQEDDENEEEGGNEDEWTRDATRVNRVPDQPELTVNPGLKVNFPDDPEPSDYFRLFFTDDKVEKIASETNLFAEQTIASEENMPTQSRMQSWKPVTSHEMRLFFGVIFAMGMTEKLDIQLYWSSDEVLNTPFFGRTMSRNHFLLILQFLHFTDNTQRVPRGQDGYDPLFKIRPVYDYLRKRFADVYRPEQQPSLDESTIGWRGNL